MPGQIQKTRKKLFRSWGFHARLWNIVPKWGRFACCLITLNYNCGSNIASTGLELRLRGRGRQAINDHLPENLTNGPRTGPNRLSALVLKDINLTLRIQRKNHWLS